MFFALDFEGGPFSVRLRIPPPRHESYGPGPVPGRLNPHGKIDNVTGWVDPNHETGGLPFLGSCFDFIEAGGGEVYGGIFEESVQVPEGLKVLNGHDAPRLFIRIL